MALLSLATGASRQLGFGDRRDPALRRVPDEDVDTDAGRVDDENIGGRVPGLGDVYRRAEALSQLRVDMDKVQPHKREYDEETPQEEPAIVLSSAHQSAPFNKLSSEMANSVLWFRAYGVCLYRHILS